MPPTTRQEWLDQPIKSKPVYIIEFDGIADRFSTSTFPGLASPAKPYASVKIIGDHRVKILQAQAEVGQATFTLTDQSGEVTKFLNDNDKRLSGILVRILIGAEDLAEAEFLTTFWFLRDYSLESDWKWRFELLDVLRQLDQPLWDAIEQPTLKLGSKVNHLDTEILPEEFPNEWKVPGEALLHNTTNEKVELIRYEAIDQLTGKLLNVTRQFLGVGDGGTIFDIKDGEIIHCVAFRDSPKNIFLQRVLTTKDGSGPAPYDLGNGEGAGIPEEAVDIAQIESKFDDADHGVDDWILLFHEKKSTTVKKFVEKQILVPTSQTESVNAAGQLIVEHFEQTPSTITPLNGLFNKKGPFGLKRNFRQRINVLLTEGDFHLGLDKAQSLRSLRIRQSIIRFFEGKEFKIGSRGFRGKAGVKFGYPDLGGDGHADTAMLRIAEIQGTPPQKIKIRTALKFQDIPPAQGIQISHAALPDTPAQGTRGIVDKVLTVLSKKVSLRGNKPWPVTFECEARGTIGRVFRWGDPAASSPYDTASDAEKAANAYWSDPTTLEPGSDNALGYYYAHEEQT